MINIVVSINKNYIEPLGVMLNSLLSNTITPVSIHVVHSDLQPIHTQLLDAVVSKYGHAKLEYFRVVPDRLAAYAVRGHLTVVSYFLFLFPQILPQGIDKVLYLDPDLIVESDISTLWDVDLGDNLLGAVPVMPAYYHERIVTEGQDYFNGGVLLINLKLWRKNNITDELFQAVVDLRPYIASGVNQDVMNVVFRGRWMKMPIEWNKCPEFYLGIGTSIYPEEDVKKAGRCGIIHFTGPVKPWHYACSHPKRDLYQHYRADTPWGYEPLIGRNFISLLSRIMPMKVTHFISRKLAHTALASRIKRYALLS